VNKHLQKQNKKEQEDCKGNRRRDHKQVGEIQELLLWDLENLLVPDNIRLIRVVKVSLAARRRERENWSGWCRLNQDEKLWNHSQLESREVGKVQSRSPRFLQTSRAFVTLENVSNLKLYNRHFPHLESWLLRSWFIWDLLKTTVCVLASRGSHKRRTHNRPL